MACCYPPAWSAPFLCKLFAGRAHTRLIFRGAIGSGRVASEPEGWQRWYRLDNSRSLAEWSTIAVRARIRAQKPVLARLALSRRRWMHAIGFPGKAVERGGDCDGVRMT